jgi:muconate cycloisomerase
MKITSIDIFSVVVPTIPGRVHSASFGDAGWDQIPKRVFRLNTDEDVYGLGEAIRGTSVEAIQGAFDRLEGRDPLKLSLQNVFVDSAPRRYSSNGVGDSVLSEDGTHPLRGTRDWESLNGWGTPSGYEAFEMAIFDIVGKVRGQPVHELLGGAYRNRVSADYWIGHQTPEDSAANARIGFDRGFHGVKMKCTSDEPMVERVQAILEATDSTFKCTIDPNQRFYRPSEAIKLARQFEEVGNVGVLEDPMAKWNLDWYRQLRAATTIPVALHLGNPHDIVNAIKAEAVDIFNLGGSMWNFVKNAAIADAAGIPCWHGSGNDLGVMEMSYLHAASVPRNCVLPSDFVGSWTREDDVIVEGIQLEEGNAIVPDAPGLGCELDEDAIEKYRVS